MRVFVALLLTLCLAHATKILNIIPFGDTSLKVVLDKPILQKDLRIKKIGEFSEFLELDGAIIPFSKKKYSFRRGLSIVVAQNTPKRIRIVIVGDKQTSYQLRFDQHILYISFVDRIPLLREKKSKTTSSSAKRESKAAQVANVKKTISKHHDKTDLLKTGTKANSEIKNQNPKRAFRIVVDAGHGGKDCGAMGASKVCEKVIVLSVAKMLEKELKRRGYTVFMTRSSDVYIDLKKRTEMANIKNAHLFVSIHANSVGKNGNLKAQGVETYFLSTARSERAKDVAEQENKGDVETMNYFSKLSFLNTLNSHRLIASNKLAIDIQSGILKELRNQYDGVIDGGVREGPFWVLAGALMPSVLIEIGYNSHEIESKRLNNKEYQKYLALGIANGIDGFVAKNF